MTGRAFDVLLETDHVGSLIEDDSGRIAFRLVDGYRALVPRPIVSQSFEDDLLKPYVAKKVPRLPAFFSNLLPEGRLRAILESSLGIEPDDDLGVLVATAVDLPGALLLRPSVQDEGSGTLPPLPDEEPDGGSERMAFRFSLAGVQLKFSMVRKEERLAVAAHGSRGDWIVKIGSAEFPGLPENEYTVMEWAREAGFDVPECEIHSVDDVPEIRKYVEPGSNVFAIRRFDRRDHRRIHQEDFMQVFGWPLEGERKYDSRYEDLGRVMFALLGEDGYLEFVRRLALVVAAGNNDAHLKNWGLLYRDPTTPSLSPVYDQVSTVAWGRLDRELALKLVGAREFGRVDDSSFERLATSVGASGDRTLAVARETVDRLRLSWDALGGRRVMPDSHVAALVDHWRKVPFLRGVGLLRE